MNENTITIDNKLHVEYDLKFVIADKCAICVSHTFNDGTTCLKYRENQLLLFKTDCKLALNKNECLSIDVNTDEIIPQYVYAVSNEDTKVGDWRIRETSDGRYIELVNDSTYDFKSDKYFKIIASNNPFINSPLFTIDFLEELVKKQLTDNEISKVLIEVEVEKKWIAGSSIYGHGNYNNIFTPVVDSFSNTITIRQKTWTKEEILDFIQWYSGMERSKIETQFDKYQAGYR